MKLSELMEMLPDVQVVQIISALDYIVFYSGIAENYPRIIRDADISGVGIRTINNILSITIDR